MRAPRRGLGLAAALVFASLVAAGFGGPAQAGAPPAQCHAADGQVFVPAGEVDLRDDDGPGRTVRVGAFWIDRHEVTNREFAAFVKATGHVTQAEREHRGAVFTVPARLARGLDDPSQWWRFVWGASWRRPEGLLSSIGGKPDRPVVQVAYEDALAYARWKGRALPSEAEWERAARGGRPGPLPPAEWAYGRGGKPIANTWQGVFPLLNTSDDGAKGIAPVGCYPPNGYGLHDMIGNVWEWTSTSAGQGAARIIKGGSYLCAMNYCSNFHPAARQAEEHDLATSHVGFRTISYRAGPPARRKGVGV
jgi:formylglycine-generating enzyme